MKKQTAVEWLGLNLNALFLDISPELWLEVELIFQKAKAMEKEQIELAFDEGLEYEYEHHINGYPRIEPSTYYNETYGGDK